MRRAWSDLSAIPAVPNLEEEVWIHETWVQPRIELVLMVEVKWIFQMSLVICLRTPQGPAFHRSSTIASVHECLSVFFNHCKRAWVSKCLSVQASEKGISAWAFQVDSGHLETAVPTSNCGFWRLNLISAVIEICGFIHCFPLFFGLCGGACSGDTVLTGVGIKFDLLQKKAKTCLNGYDSVHSGALCCDLYVL